MQFTGIDDFDAQFKNWLNTLISEIFEALNSTMGEARDALKQHIENDVYEAYSPTVYKRRSERQGLGTPLSDMNAYAKIIEPTGGNVGGNLVVDTVLHYNPKGEHRTKKWDTADFNDLIGRIEEKMPAYTWGNNIVPARPFWQNFIDEMVSSGELEKAFVWAMSKNEEIVADGNIKEDPWDREYK